MNNERKTEFALATGKGILGQIPLIGPVAVEWLNLSLPQRRLERVESMLRHFAA